MIVKVFERLDEDGSKGQQVAEGITSNGIVFWKDPWHLVNEGSYIVETYREDKDNSKSFEVR